MTPFRYRAATVSGALRTGSVQAESAADALEQLRRLGLIPIEATAIRSKDMKRHSGALKPIPVPALSKTLGQLAVMLDAGVALDRALATLVEDMPSGSAQRSAFEPVLRQVREGRALSRAMSDAGRAFPPIAAAMTAAGEADGRPGSALAKLASTLDQAQALRSTLISAMIYPVMLLVIANGVIALMLFWVVPQFEGLFSDAAGSLPPMTRLVLAVSHGARRYGLFTLLGLIAAGYGGWRLLQRPEVRSWADRSILRVPRLGPLVNMAECARFMRVLASLVGGGVGLPEALAISRRSLLNSHMAAAVDRVAKGLREGEGLTEPLAATGVFPRLALSYLRTGEQTAQLPLMLERLADTLDRDVRIQLERMIGLLTPLITVAMGAIVATIIASIMTAILGFDDLALTK
ncbi:type II secretion system F family protein [Caulobacter sp. S45]|uniref:type II secretion system F family protein n=1 Tax=Caulobacter sp. S45 TaxID=1641861 RepID=UPI001575E444|nr:type II secretion system F family protein [Caulobacter sp. S45]